MPHLRPARTQGITWEGGSQEHAASRRVRSIQLPAPLTLQLLLAAQQARLAWWSPQIFALLELPTNHSAQGGSRWLRWLNRWWDPLMFTVPPVVLLGAAALLALPPDAARWRLMTALVCVLAVLAFVALLMTAVAVRGFLSLYRTLIIGRSKEVTDSGIGQVLASHWSMPLANSPRRTLTALPRGCSMRCNIGWPNRSPLHLTVDMNRSTFSVPNMGHVSGGSRRTTSGPASQRVHADPPVLVIRFDLHHHPVVPATSAREGGRTTAARNSMARGRHGSGHCNTRSVCSKFWEGEECGGKHPERQLAGCADQPTTYGDALYWLLNRLSGGDPEGRGEVLPTKPGP